MSAVTRLRRRYQARRFHDLVAGSWLFDAPWYLQTYEDVKRAGVDPATHYLRVGALEDRDPGPAFDTSGYRELYPDVAASGINPLVHYLLYGEAENRTAPGAVAEQATPQRRPLDVRSRTMTANGRSFESALTPPLIDSIQHGSLRWRYRDVLCQKNPFDLALYTMLIGRLRPGAVLEVGTFQGGSALWFADMLDAHGVEGARVVTIDVKPAVAEHDPRVTYLTGTALRLDEILTDELLASLPRPWLVIDDGSHLEDEITIAIDWFHPHLQSGDYLVVEDGSLRSFSDPSYDYYRDGPNRAVAAFSRRTGTTTRSTMTCATGTARTSPGTSTPG